MSVGLLQRNGTTGGSRSKSPGYRHSSYQTPEKDTETDGEWTCAGGLQTCCH